MVALFKDIFYENNTEDNVRISTIHYVPEMLNEDDLAQAIMVEEVPEPEPKDGCVPYLHCNPQTKELWYEYEEVPPTSEERLEAVEAALLGLLFHGGDELDV